jgi:hypothetical protein
MTTVAPPLADRALRLELELEQAAITDRIVMIVLDPRHPERSYQPILPSHGHI